MPVPPQAAAPAPITDLRYSLNQAGAVLTWSYPRQLVNGERLSEIDSFRLWRAAVEADSCTGCPLPYVVIEVAGGSLPGDGGGRTARHQDADLRPGYHYFYKVQAAAAGGIFGPDSNQVDFIWQGPAAAPDKPAGQPAE